jgi:hypothetical protein
MPNARLAKQVEALKRSIPEGTRNAELKQEIRFLLRAMSVEGGGRPGPYRPPRPGEGVAKAMRVTLANDTLPAVRG